ncbi:MAG: ParB N-terminal domain-containing protein [Flavobacterium sp.]|uniref:ParB N-terminal domain-containing protein n=1 Tax=Flavobacterium sp. TaxID=239 RepID=UPI003BE9BACB
MEIKATSIVMVPINKIIPNDKNNNIHTEEQKRYARKIFDYQGFRAPLLISNRTGKLVAGHLRLEIAKEKGVKELPCMFQDFDSEEQEYAHLTADNALAAQSSLDFGQINTDILEFGPFDIELLGIKDFVIEPLEGKFPELESGEPDCQEVTFVLSNEQKDILDEAIAKAKKKEDTKDELNQNSNGNALAAIVKRYVYG